MRNMLVVTAIAATLSACVSTPWVRPWARSNEEAAAWRDGNRKCKVKADHIRQFDWSNETETKAVKAYETCMNDAGFYRIN